MPFVDFAELKTRVLIEQAMQMLGLTLTLTHYPQRDQPAGDHLRRRAS